MPRTAGHRRARRSGHHVGLLVLGLEGDGAGRVDDHLEEGDVHGQQDERQPPSAVAAGRFPRSAHGRRRCSPWPYADCRRCGAPAGRSARPRPKSSSSRTIEDASRATSVPRPPMAMPMSARLRLGASLTPSPVIATTSPRACSAFDDAQLLLRQDARKHSDGGDSLPQRGVGKIGQFPTGHHRIRRKPGLSRNRLGRGWVIAGDHHHADARGEALGDGAWHLRRSGSASPTRPAHWNV